MKAVWPRALALVLAGVGSPSCGEEQSCTEIGCSDGFTLTIRRADGTPPTEAVGVSGDLTPVTCPPVSIESPFASCGEGVEANLIEELSCTRYGSGDGSDGDTCVSTGRYELVVTVAGTPAEVSVTLTDGDRVVAETTFASGYEASYPNGPDCGPACQQATERWDLPE